MHIIELWMHSIEPYWCMMHSHIDAWCTALNVMIEPYWCLMQSIEPYWCLIHSIEPYYSCMMHSYIDVWCTVMSYILMPDSIELWMHSTITHAWCNDIDSLMFNAQHWAILMHDAQHSGSLIQIAEQLDACSRARASSMHAPLHANLTLGCACSSKLNRVRIFELHGRASCGLANNAHAPDLQNGVVVDSAHERWPLP